MIHILNDKLSVRISEKGAELQSVQSNGIEYLWQADPAFWAKHSPVLFPFIGELKDGKYIFQGTEYKMPRHGFARDKVFATEQTSDASAIFILYSDKESVDMYPFTFIFKIEYKLEGSGLSCTYMVENRDNKTMYFSVGGHPAFKVPITDTLQYTDYMLKFDCDDVLEKYVLHDGLTDDGTETIMLHNKELQLHSSLFYADAIVLKHIKSRRVDLVTGKDSHGLRVTFDGFPFFGIWAAKDFVMS
jgi:galactose mutarotase-like enzyme